MKLLMIVNESPWGSVLANSALRLARAAHGSALRVDAVFFREDGVYNALPAETRDAGAIDLFEGWCALAASGTGLLVCSASWRRRERAQLPPPFIQAGLADALQRMLDCDRVVSF